MKSGVFGEMMLTYFAGRGGVGAVIDGCIRDFPKAKQLELGLWIRGTTPNFHTQTGIFPFAVNVPIACGGRLVMPGDIIVADDDGAIVVPVGAGAEAAGEKSASTTNGRNSPASGSARAATSGATIRSPRRRRRNSRRGRRRRRKVPGLKGLRNAVRSGGRMKGFAASACGIPHLTPALSAPRGGEGRSLSTLGDDLPFSDGGYWRRASRASVAGPGAVALRSGSRRVRRMTNGYLAYYTDPAFIGIILLSLKVTLTAVACAAVVGLPLGAALALARFPGAPRWWW